MNALELIESFSEFKEFKNIDRETMMNILQEPTGYAIGSDPAGSRIDPAGSRIDPVGLIL